jgi:hypothetical protein
MSLSLTEDIKSVSEFKKRIREVALNLRALLAAGESDIATGHTRSARAAVRALRRAKKISR